jgi:signal transduction histidine kinase
VKRDSEAFLAFVAQVPIALGVYTPQGQRLASSSSFADLDRIINLDAWFRELRSARTAGHLDDVSRRQGSQKASGGGRRDYWLRASAHVVDDLVWMIVDDETEFGLREMAAKGLVHSMERALAQARAAAARAGSNLRTVEAVFRFVHTGLCILERDGRISKVASPGFLDLLGRDIVGRHIGEIVGGEDGHALDEIYRLWVVNPEFSAEQLRSMTSVSWHVEGRRLGLRLEPVEDDNGGGGRWAVCLVEDLSLATRRALLDALTHDSRAMMVLASTAPDVFRVAQQEAAHLTSQLLRLASDVALSGGDSPALPRIRELIHSLKSIVASHAMQATSERLHHAEELLAIECADARTPILLEIVDIIGEIDRVFREVGQSIDIADARSSLTIASSDYARYRGLLHAANVPEVLLEVGRWLGFRPAKQLFAGAVYLSAEAGRRGKEVLVSFEDHDLLVDLAFLAPVLEILPHLARNAIAHGVEMPSMRRLAGKPALAKVSLETRLDDESFVIVVSDDGCGIDVAQVWSRARELGINMDPQVEERVLLDVLAHPKFSLAKQVDELAGRGIGLCAVVRAVRALEGELTLNNYPGAGVRFEVRIPNRKSHCIAITRGRLEDALSGGRKSIAA